MRPYDSQSTARIANFVKGRTGIPRAMFIAAFPSANTSIISILTALGHLEKSDRTNHIASNLDKARAALAAKRAADAPIREAKKAAARAEKVAKLEARIAKLRG